MNLKVAQRFGAVMLSLNVTSTFAELPPAQAPAAAEALKVASASRVSHAVAASRTEEIESIVRLTADGEALYQADNNKKTGYQYCSAASALAERGEFRRAIREASKALFLGLKSGDEDVLAHAKRDFAIAYSYSGNLDKAEEFAGQALRHYVASRNRAAVHSRANKVLGDVAMRRNDPAKAIAFYEKAAHAAEDDLRFYARSALALAYAELDKPDMAREALSKAESYVDRVSERGKAGARATLRRARASLALREGRFDDAATMFEVVLTQAVEGGADEAPYERFRGYEGIGRAKTAKGDKAGAVRAYLEAIRISEQVRARFRSEEIKAGLFGKMQHVFEEAVSLLLETGQLETAWEVSERGRSRALLDMVRNRVTLSAGESVFADPLGRVASLTEIRSRLRTGDAVVEFHVTDRSTHAWVIRESGVSSVTLASTRKQLGEQVGALRDALAERQPVAAELGRRLHEALIKPLGIRSGERLLIVPHDALHYLPFQALRSGDRFLIELHAVSYVPSVSTLLAIAQRGVPGTGRLLALANPDLGDPALALPGAQVEVEQIRRLFPESDAYFLGEATKQRLMQRAAQSRIIHVAAHAQADPLDPLHSRIRLARTDSDSGTIEAHEIYGLDLKGAALVTLSACETGLGKVSRGDEIWGFTRSFLSAGSSAVLVSLWPISDDATEMLMTRFYRALTQTDAREALRQAQVEVMKDARFSHPYFWAPFVLVGGII